MQVWAADEATDEEVQRYRAGGSELLEHGTASDTMNDTVDSTLRQMRDDTRIVDENGKPFRTVTRFRDFTDVTGTSTRCSPEGSPPRRSTSRSGSRWPWPAG